MGKFINTEHKDMIDALTKGVVKDMVKNPYYLFENTKATPVIFYELCDESTTLDDSTRELIIYIYMDCKEWRFMIVMGNLD